MECAVPSASNRWCFDAPLPTLQVVNARIEESLHARLHRGANDVQLFKDWMELRAYCFRPSEGHEHPFVHATEVPPQFREVVIFIFKTGQEQLVAAGAGVIPMTQNVRGVVFPMAGLRGVSAFPERRRKGHVTAVMQGSLALMHEHAVPFSTLYPFKASFYEKMGYVCVGSKRKVVFSPTIFVGLRPSSTVQVERKKASDWDKEEYIELLARMQKKIHGFARFADKNLEKHVDWTEKIMPHWVAIVRDHKGIAGVMGYRMGSFMTGSMEVDIFAYANVTARTALLSWIGFHADQLKDASLIISPAEDFENWVSDAAFNVQSVEIQKPQMARVVSVKGLEGLPVGGKDDLQLDFTLLDPFFPINHRQRFRFTVGNGRLYVHHKKDEDEAPQPGGEAELHVHGLTALVFGVVREGADEIESRGWGSIPTNDKATRKAIKAMFPPTTKPLLFEAF